MATMKPARSVFAAVIAGGLLAGCATTPQGYQPTNNPSEVFNGMNVIPTTRSTPATSDDNPYSMPYTVRTFDPVTGKYMDEITGTINLTGQPHPRIIGECRSKSAIMGPITFDANGHAQSPRQVGADSVPTPCPGQYTPNLVIW